MKQKPVMWIVKKIRRRLPLLLAMTAAQVGHSLLSVLLALGSRAVIDSAVGREAGRFYAACLQQLGIIAGIVLCLTALRHLRERLHAEMDRDWKQTLLHGLLHGEFSAVRQYHSGELINRLNADVKKVSDGVLTIVPGAAAMLTRLAAAVTVLGVLDVRFTLLLAALGGGMILATGLMRKKLKELNKRVSEHDGRVSGFLQEMMEKLMLVQAMDVSDEVERRAGVLLDQRYDAQRKRKNMSLVTHTGVSIMAQGAGFLALCWGAWRLLTGQMSFGSLTALIQLVGQLQAPFVNLSGVLPQYAAMMASAERLMELEDIRAESESRAEDAAALYARMHSLCAENLTFAYEQETVIGGASFELPKGAFAVITGPSGAGKSTLLKLLLGIYSPQAGGLSLRTETGDVPLNRSTRRLFAYVPQGNLLFSGTLRDNLTIANPGATQEELHAAIHASVMDEFLPELPHGLDTVLGENGFGLSEGQAQRLAVARALVGGAPVLLLDECTSALDEATEKKLLQRLKALHGRTCIAVTHRPAAVDMCTWQLMVSGTEIRAVRMQ